MSTEIEFAKELGISRSVAEILVKNGISTLEALNATADSDLLAIPRIGPARVAEVRAQAKAMTPREEEPAPAFAAPRDVTKELVSDDPQTALEARQADAIKMLQSHALNQQQAIRGLQKVLTRIGDDLVKAGNTADAIRGYWPDYQSPEERGDV